MSTLWTPDGERPIPRDRPAAGGGPGQPTGPTGPARPPDGEGGGPQSEEEIAAQLEELREQLANTPAVLVVANHAFGLFELAALHLSLKPPKLDEAQVAIDALGAIVEGLRGRLGEHETQLQEGLSQLRIAYVQIKAANSQS